MLPLDGSPAEHMECLEVCGGSQLTARGGAHGWRSPSLPLPTAARAAPANLNGSLPQAELGTQRRLSCPNIHANFAGHIPTSQELDEQ